jgi:hypothetical protein
MLLVSIALLLHAQCGISQRDSDTENSLPVQLPQAVIEGRSAGVCPSTNVTERARNATQEAIRSILRNSVYTSPFIDRCPCGGSGPWRRIAYLNMTDHNQQCPSNLNLITSNCHFWTNLRIAHVPIKLVPPTHECVGESTLSNEETLMHSGLLSVGVLVA